MSDIVFAIVMTATTTISLAAFIFKMIIKHRLKSRKGVIKIPINRMWDRDNSEWASPTVVVVVEEESRISDQSKMKILHIDHEFKRGGRTHNDIVKLVTHHLGHYYDTDKIDWDYTVVPEVEKPIVVEEDEVTKIIKTDMKDLVRHIETENIKDM